MNLICLGPKGTYSHLAAMEYDKNARISFVGNISEGFEKLKTGKYDYFVAPVENMIYGTVRETLDGLYDYDFKINDSVTLPIHHFLLAKTKSIKTIYSHPQALNQCRKYFKKKYPKAKLIPCESTAKACEIAEKEKNSAAVAHKINLEFYKKLKEIDDDIEDYKKNRTKFLVIGDEYNLVNKKTSSIIIIPKKDESGILYKILKILKSAKINLTRIESRPLRTNLGKYMFYVDLEGDFRNKKVMKAFAKLEKSKYVGKVKILGSY